MAATNPPLPSNVNLAPTFLISCWILSTLGILSVVVRICSRLKIIRGLYVDDYAIIFATVSLTFEMAFITVSCHYGLGRHDVYVSPENFTKALYFLYISVFPAYLAISTARVSVGLMLLRLKRDSVPWRFIIWVVISAQMIAAVSSTIIQPLQCRPVSALWAPTPDMKCMPPKMAQLWAFTFSGLAILTDILFALVPITFIWTLHRPRLEKILIGCLMALGLVTSALAILKMIRIVQSLYRGPDFMFDMMDLTLWVKLEEILIIIAASAPSIKSTVERVLRCIGILAKSSQEYLHIGNLGGEGEPKSISIGLGSLESEVAELGTRPHGREHAAVPLDILPDSGSSVANMKQSSHTATSE